MAKSRSIGGIYASLSLRDGGFKKGVKSSSDTLKKFGAASLKYAAIGATVRNAALTAGSLRTLDQVDALGDLAAQTGVAVSDMMTLQQAYKDGGRAAEMAGKDIGKMQKSLVAASEDVDAGDVDPFASIGLSAKELLTLNPADQFNKIGEAIMKIQNPAERTAKAMEIFGKGGMGLTTVFEGIPNAVVALGSMPQIAQEFAGRMGEANDLIGHLPVKSDQFFMGFTAGIVGSILPGLNSVNEFDFTPLGMNLGKAIAAGLEELAVIVNTTMDVAMGEDSLGTLGGNRYAEAQTALTEEDRLAGFLKEYERQQADKAKQPDEYVPKVFQYEKQEPAKIPDSKPMVNEYQKRGLGLDGAGTSNASKVDEQIDLTTQMRDLLKKITDNNGMLVFGKV
jgi:hypothetical protein